MCNIQTKSLYNGLSVLEILHIVLIYIICIKNFRCTKLQKLRDRLADILG